MTSSPLTDIPTTQPSCGPITLASPRPQCNSSSAEPMGCFIQRTGFFCAPLRTTRGFLYTLDNTPATPAIHTPPTLLTRLSLIPRLSFVSSFETLHGGSNSDSNTLPSLGIDHQPLKAQGPARLGQSCVGIPTPPQTDPLWTVLVTLANMRLEEVLKGASPGMGAGADVLSRRGDCEPGSYCDFSQVPAGGGGGGEIERVGTCKEQLPDYHECTSYFECLSLQCGSRASLWTESKAGSSNLHLTKPGHEQHHHHHRAVAAALAETGPSQWPKRSSLHQRNLVNVCVPARRDSGSNGPGLVHGGGGGAEKSVFPAWKAALIAMLVLAAVALVFLLVRRRRRLQAQKELERQQRQQRQLLLQKARFMGEGWDRSPTLNSEFCWKGPDDAEKAGAQDLGDMDTRAKGESWFHKWFVRGHVDRQRSEDGKRDNCKVGEAPLSVCPGPPSPAQSSDTTLQSEGLERVVVDSAEDLNGIDVESTSASSTAVPGSITSSSPPETIVVPFDALSAESTPSFGPPAADLPESSSNRLRVSASGLESSTRFYPTTAVSGVVSPPPSAPSSPRPGRVLVSRLGSGISSIFPTRSYRSSEPKVVFISPISPVSTGTGVSSRLSSRNSHQARRSLNWRS